MSGASAFEILRSAAPTVSVGMATADLSRLGEELAAIETAGVKVLHFDVMDGRFCPMMTFGPPLVKAARTAMLKDVHLMIEEPLGQLDVFAAAGADVITIHVESTRHPHRALQAIGNLPNANDPARGIVRGIGLNPGTPLEALDPLLDEVDIVTLLAVNPGWGGQKFIPATAGRLARLKEMIRVTGRPILTCIDGGIHRGNIAEVAAMGPDLIVTGSAVFDGKAPADNARFMLRAVRGGK